MSKSSEAYVLGPSLIGLGGIIWPLGHAVIGPLVTATGFAVIGYGLWLGSRERANHAVERDAPQDQWSHTMALTELGDDSIYSPSEKLRRAREYFRTVVEAAQSGRAQLHDVEVARDFLIKHSRYYNASGPGYVADFELVEKAFRDLLPPPRQHSLGSDVDAVCKAIMSALRDADGNGVYLTQLERDIGTSKLKLDEAIARLVRQRFVEQLGDWEHPILYLTDQGRSSLFE